MSEHSLLQVKGSVFSAVIYAVEQLQGEAFYSRVKAAVPGDAGEALRFGGIVANGWYPIAWYRSFYSVVVREAGEDTFARKVGRASMARDISTIHRMVFRFLSVELLLKQATRLVAQYYRGGSVSVDAGVGNAKITFVNFYGFDQVLWLDTWGSIEEMLVQTGARNSRVLLQEKTDEDSRAVFLAEWKAT